MACSTENLNVLSSILSTNITTYLDRLNATSLPLPTLKPAPPVFLNDSTALQAKAEIIKACEQIMTLVKGPFESVLMISLAFHETTALQIALDMKLAEHIPMDGDVSLDVLAEKTGGSRDLILRVLRALAQRNCFVETSPLHYAHTGLSAVMTVMPLNAFLSHTVHDSYTSGPHVTDVLKENSFAVPDDPSKTGFNRAFKTDLPFFDYIYTDTDTSRAERFGLAMKGLSMAGHSPQNTYTPIQFLPAGSTIVDVGGGLGQVSITMAKAVPGLKFIVQDQESVITQGRDECPQELSDRIEYQVVDFFKEQPVKGADVYYLKSILHDHPNSNCHRILSNIVAAMNQKTSRILLNDMVLPERIGPNQDRLDHMVDFQMLTLCNSLERTENQWKALLKSVDERLVLEKIWSSVSTLAPIIECRLRE